MAADGCRWRNYEAWIRFWLRDADMRLRGADIHENARCFARAHLYRAGLAARGGDVDAMNLHLGTIKKYLGRPSL